MPRWARHLLSLALLAIAAIPAAFIITFMLYPLWSWIEATYGIESVGHSGPADWCFFAIFGVLVALAAMLVWLSWKRSERTHEDLHT